MAKKLLIVDSDVTVQEMVTTTLSGDQFEVTCLDDGLSALDLLGKIDPDLIIADYHMEGININRFCEKIKQKSSDKDRPILLMIGANDSYDAKSMFERGVVDFIKKPLQSVELLEKVKNLSEDSATIVGRPHSAPAGQSSEEAKESEESSKIEKLLGWSLPSDSAGGTLTQKVAKGAADSDNENTMIVMRPPPPPAQETASESPPAEASSPPISHDTLEAQFPQLYANPETPKVGAPASASQPMEGPVSEEAAGLAVNALAREIIEKVAWDVVPRLAETHYEKGGSAGSPPSTGNPATGSGAMTVETLTPQISKMAREIIEKVAWEVVPNLAETLIKAELQKLKPDQSS